MCGNTAINNKGNESMSKAKNIIDTMEQELTKDNVNIPLVIELVGTLKSMTEVCKECAADFFKKRYDQVFCSERCSSRYRQRKYKKNQMYSKVLEYRANKEKKALQA